MLQFSYDSAQPARARVKTFHAASELPVGDTQNRREQVTNHESRITNHE